MVAFKVPAIALGLLIGCLLCFTNLYFGLQTGWISMMSLQSALIGFLLSRIIPERIMKCSPQTTVIIQTTAVATGTMPLAAGFVGILPALGMLDEEKDGRPPIQLSWLAAVGWSCAVAFFGVFLSPPLRQQVIIEEKLPFPSGTATAQLISVLHRVPVEDGSVRQRKGYQRLHTDETDTTPPATASTTRTSTDEERVDDSLSEADREAIQEHGWSALLWSFSASSLMTLTAYFYPVVFAIPLFGRHLAQHWLWTFTPSLSYVGQGIIMGFPTTVSMNLGMLVGWGLLSPLSQRRGWAPGPTGDMATGARGWILWVSLAIMCADSVVSLLPVMWEFVAKRLYGGPLGAPVDGGEDDGEVETEDRLVPMAWVAWGLGASVLLGTVLIWAVFGEKPWVTAVGFVAGSMLSVLGVRALGETDLNPVSGLGKISQLLFAVLQPGNIVANLVAGGVTEAGAQQAGDLMQDLKTGHLVHASPRAQFYGQLIGSSVSIVVTTTAYNLYNRAYAIPGPSFPAPTAYVWLSLARLLRDGQLPPQSDAFMIGFAALFGLLSALKTRAARRGAWYAAYLPSGVAFAIGFLNTPAFSLARLAGGAVEHVYRRRFARGGRDIRLVVVASGFVLGEGVVSIATLVLRTWGVGVASCWGCGHGLCSGCAA